MARLRRKQNSSRFEPLRLQGIRGGIPHSTPGGQPSTFCRAPQLPIELCGLHFLNPVGLAAGMDKQAEAVPVWEALGFGFVELGGVTWQSQPGNPAPRLFRAVAEGALVNGAKQAWRG